MEWGHHLSSTHINGNHTKKSPQQQSESELTKHHSAKLNIETKTMDEKRLEKMKLNTCSNNCLKPKSITRKEVLHAATAISSPKASHQEVLHVGTAISSPQSISSGSTTCSGGNLKSPSIIRKTDWTMSSSSSKISTSEMCN